EQLVERSIMSTASPAASARKVAWAPPVAASAEPERRWSSAGVGVSGSDQRSPGSPWSSTSSSVPTRMVTAAVVSSTRTVAGGLDAGVGAVAGGAGAGVGAPGAAVADAAATAPVGRAAAAGGAVASVAGTGGSGRVPTGTAGGGRCPATATTTAVDAPRASRPRTAAIAAATPLRPRNPLIECSAYPASAVGASFGQKSTRRYTRAPHRGCERNGSAACRRAAARLGEVDGVAHEHRDRHRPDALRHRGQPAGDRLDRGAVDVAGQPAVDTVDPDVDDTRTGLDEGRVDEPGTADRGDEDVGLAADGGELAGARVADSDGGVGVEQEQRHRAADDDRAADDHGAGAAHRNVVAAEELHASRRGAGGDPRPALGEQPEVAGMEAVDVLLRRHRVEDARGVDVGGEGQLDEDGVDRLGVVEPVDEVA